MNDKIGGYVLDKQQQAIVLDTSKYLLVVAGAGSGKTLTILGKIYYLVKYKKICPKDILCISFTKASSDNLRDKIEKEFGLEIPVYTFHKLSLEILKEKDISYHIASPETLDWVMEKIFTIELLNYPFHMKKILEYFDIYSKDNIQEEYLKFYHHEQIKIKMLKKLLIAFISLFKCNAHELIDFSVFLKKSKRTLFFFRHRKEKIFLTLALNVYLQYESYLKENQEIDFNDMITLATEQVSKYGISKNYQYIIIDEYQDTSFVRFQLIQSILKNTSASLMVVGDDFQSIYRFTGCDLSLFLDFPTYFDGAKIKRIENTYRNSQELITVAGSFVMRNRLQIPKNLHSDKHIDKPIKVFYYQDARKDFFSLLEIIYQNNPKPIMILGRNNRDIEKILYKDCKVTEDGKINIPKLPNLKLYYLTTHKSKGLEEENVVIINLVEDKLGFPNNISDEKVLRFVSLKKEKYPFAEERRLFYVALTRTKKIVYLYVPKKKISPFVKELLKYYQKYIEIIK